MRKREGLRIMLRAPSRIRRPRRRRHPRGHRTRPVQRVRQERAHIHRRVHAPGLQGHEAQGRPGGGEDAAREGRGGDHEEGELHVTPGQGDQGERGRGCVRDVRGVLQSRGEEEQGRDQDTGGEGEVQEG